MGVKSTSLAFRTFFRKGEDMSRSVLYTFHSFGINVHLGFKELTGFKLSCRKCTRDSYHFLLLSVSIGFFIQ